MPGTPRRDGDERNRVPEWAPGPGWTLPPDDPARPPLAWDVPAEDAPRYRPRPRTRLRLLVRSRRTWLVAGPVLGVVVGIAALSRLEPPTLPLAGDVADTVVTATAGPVAPTTEGSASPTGRPSPLGTPEPLATPDSRHAFSRMQADGVTPVAFAACRPVRYVVRTEGQPAGGDRIIADAVARISRATGLKFVDEGTTDEAPGDDRPTTDEARYGAGWSPVLVAWATAAEYPRFAGDTAGTGTSVTLAREGSPSVYVSGQVALSADWAAEHIAEGPEGEHAVYLVVLHELAHVLGLDHVDAADQVMAPDLDDTLADLGAGDLTGLARLGQGACLPER